MKIYTTSTSCAIFVIILALSVGLVDSQVTDLCPLGYLNMTNLGITTTGAFEISNCALGQLVNISAEFIPPYTSAADSVQVSVTQCIVDPSGCLQIVGPSFEVANGYAPLHLTIKTTQFQVSAAFRFQGSLPPNSFLLFEQNNMSAAKRNEYTGMVGSWTTMVSIVTINPIHIYEGSEINFRDNSFASIGDITTISQVTMMFSTLVFHANTTLNIGGNHFDLNESWPINSEAIAIFFVLAGNIQDVPQSDVSFIGDNARFIVEYNTFDMTTVTNGAMAFISATNFAASSTDLQGIVFALRNNIFNFASDATYVTPSFYVLGLLQVNQLIISENEWSTNTDALIVVMSIVILSTEGRLLVSKNNYANVDPNNVFLYCFFLLSSISFNAGATGYMIDNHITMANETTSALPGVYLFQPMSPITLKFGPRRIRLKRSCFIAVTRCHGRRTPMLQNYFHLKLSML